MAHDIPFVRVLAYLQEHGWEFAGFWTPYRVFEKQDRLPIMVEVHDKVVSHEAFEQIKAVVEREQQREEPED